MNSLQVLCVILLGLEALYINLFESRIRGIKLCITSFGVNYCFLYCLINLL